MSERKRPCQSCRGNVKRPISGWECAGCGAWNIVNGKAVRA